MILKADENQSPLEEFIGFGIGRRMLDQERAPYCGLSLRRGRGIDPSAGGRNRGGGRKAHGRKEQHHQNSQSGERPTNPGSTSARGGPRPSGGPRGAHGLPTGPPVRGVVLPA